MITVKELKEWLAALPPEYDKFTLVNGERGKWSEEYSYRLDKPIVTLDIDENDKEIIFLHQNKED